MRFYRTFLILVSLSQLQGCTYIDVADLDGARHRYFGFVDIEIPQTENSIKAIKIQMLGVAFDEGIVVGWNDKELITVPLREPTENSAPFEATCSLIAIIRSAEEAEHAQSVLGNLNGGDICLATFQ